MRQHVLEQTAARLGRFAYQVARTTQMVDPDAIHDLRVSIRRLSQCLRIFIEFFPPPEVKRVRRRLRRIIELAAEARNRDIAAELLAKGGAAPRSPLAARLAEERKLGARALAAELRRLTRRDFSSKWRARLQL